MRSFLAVIILGWLCGTILGVYQVSIPIVFFVILGIIGVLLSYRYPLPIVVATSILLIAGFIHGQANLPSRSVACTIQLPIEAKVADRTRVGPETVQYKVTSDTCVLLVTAPRFPLFSAGDKVRWNGRLQLVDELPDTLSGYKEYLHRQGYSAMLRYPDTQLLMSNPSWQSRWWDSIDKRIDRVFVEPEAGLTKALLLADMGTVDPAIEKAFQVTGVSHILSISGLHLSLIAGLMIGLFSFLPLSPWVRTLVVVGILSAYVGFIGWPVAALRALIFWVLVLVTARLHLLASMVSVLLMTTALVVTQNPLLWLDISWQLSCTAVLGIVIFSFLTKPYRYRRLGKVRVVISPLVVSLGATLATWPLVAYHFGIVSFVSLLANLIVVPISTVMLIVAIMGVAVSWVYEPASLWLAYIVRVLVILMSKTTWLLSQVSGAYLDEVTITPKFITFYYAGLVLLCLVWLWYQRRSWREIWE